MIERQFSPVDPSILSAGAPPTILWFPEKKKKEEKETNAHAPRIDPINGQSGKIRRSSRPLNENSLAGSRMQGQQDSHVCQAWTKPGYYIGINNNSSVE